MKVASSSRLAPNRDGSWTESVLYAFRSQPLDGHSPYAGLIFDPAGNLYGTTPDDGDGTVYKLTPEPDGSWTESVLHTFTCCTEGSDPYAGLIFDATETSCTGTTAGYCGTRRL